MPVFWISNTVPSPFAPPRGVVPNKSPLASVVTPLPDIAHWSG